MKKTKELIKILKQYEGQKRLLSSKERLLVQLEKEEITTNSISYDSISTGLTNIASPVEQAAIKRLSAYYELQSQIRQLQRFLFEIDNLVDSLKPLCSSIIRLKYIEDKTWVYIAQELNISRATAIRLKDDALSEMLETLNDKLIKKPELY